MLPADLFVKPVEGHNDLIAFQFDFSLEGKAVEGSEELTPVVAELDDGDLLIQGWASNFEGIDRQGENFAEGAFQRGIKSFLEAGGPLCFHHKHDHNIGKVLSLKEVEGKGLWMEARVDKQEPTSPLHYIYSGIKKGSMRGLSVGGFFKRAWTAAGRRIADMDFTEISVTPVPVHTRTGFAVVAGKALEGMESPAESTDTVKPEELQQLEGLVTSLRGFTEELEAKALPRSHDQSAATWLAELLANVGRTRSMASTVKEITEHDDLTELADTVETDLSKWEAAAHKLAAKVGPLPQPMSAG